MQNFTPATTLEALETVLSQRLAALPGFVCPPAKKGCVPKDRARRVPKPPENRDQFP